MHQFLEVAQEWAIAEEATTVGTVCAHNMVKAENIKPYDALCSAHYTEGGHSGSL